MENHQKLIMHPETKKNIRQEYSPKTTFRGKFEVAWKFSGPHIIENYDEIIKTVNQSIIWREIGNNEYTTAENKDFLRKSIVAYTKSIAHAPGGSQELSLAYANRSAALFKARLYEDCLLDIERALTSGYPDNLKTKLYVRQALCFKALKPGSHLEKDVSLALANHWLPSLIAGKNRTYDIAEEYTKMMEELKAPREIIKLIPKINDNNALIVGASNAIELKQTNENNQHVVATRDIKSGEFIYISEPFAATPADDLRFTNCWHCRRQTWAGIPCNICSAVIYCSDKCKAKAWDSYHKIECPVSAQFDNILPGCSPAIKLFSKTLKSVGGLLELKKKVDDIDSMQNTGFIFTNGILNVNTIDNFFNLDYFNATQNECLYGYALFAVKIVAIFGQKTDILGRRMTKEELLDYKNEKLSILGELLLRYLLINIRYAQPLFVDDPVKKSKFMLPFWKILKSSCDPNVNWTHVGSNVGYYACKPIKQGQPILGSAIGSYHITSKFYRLSRFGLTSIDYIQCKCTACDGNWLTFQSLPSYKKITLPKIIKGELKRMMRKVTGWKKLFQQGDNKKLITIKDELNSINDMIHQYITVPSKEKSRLYLLLKTLYDRLHSVHDIYD